MPYKLVQLTPQTQFGQFSLPDLLLEAFVLNCRGIC